MWYPNGFHKATKWVQLPIEQPMTIVEQRLTGIFNEWAKRYSENPDEFGEILGEDGLPVSDYGESCMRYFIQIAKEMDEACLLPRPTMPHD
jgi:hypothetical protein